VAATSYPATPTRIPQQHVCNYVVQLAHSRRMAGRGQGPPAAPAFLAGWYDIQMPNTARTNRIAQNLSKGGDLLTALAHGCQSITSM
jgi:hypothetical protein